MTPTIIGRLETRIILAFAIALPVLIFTGMANTFFIMLTIGVILEFLYNYLQYKRWDGDWPLIFVLITGIAEGIILWFLVSLQVKLKLDAFTLIYGAILLLTFLAQILLNVFFPYRKFKGGKVL